jgi:hypothetical protein
MVGQSSICSAYESSPLLAPAATQSAYEPRFAISDNPLLDGRFECIREGKCSNRQERVTKL